jgi:predicted metal-binding membrane protein
MFIERALDRQSGRPGMSTYAGSPRMIAGRLFRFPSVDRMLALGVVALAWAIALLAAVGQRDAPLHAHHLPAAASAPQFGAILLALIAWQVMTAAMMLPSSLPLLHLFVRASRGQDRPRAAVAAFLLGYFAVWTWFALMALSGAAALHWPAARTPWLVDRPWLIGGSVLLLAGVFQFSPLKERCLRECRLPFTFLRQHYRRGVPAAWDLGLTHGLFCLGCCWALMLTMFAVGVGNLAWMAALTGVMVIEKSLPWGRRLAPVVGALLIAAGLFMVAGCRGVGVSGC